MSTRRILLICIGNTLRRDDGAAHAVADVIENLDLPGVRVLRAHQLLPEHAEAASQTDALILCDASLGKGISARLEAWAPSDTNASSLHGFSIDNIAGMAQALFGRCADLHVCSIPVRDVSYGEGLSETARAASLEAARLIAEFVRDTRQTELEQRA